MSHATIGLSRPLGRTASDIADAALPRILYVDDDARARELLAAQLGGDFAVTAAASGAQALEILKIEGPFAVVISDYQMLGMSGITFLSRVKEVAPESTRLLITAYPDLTAAIGAVNDGYCYRFMTKPCTRGTMVRAVEAAVEQYQLVAARRVLLEQTLRGAIKALTDVLGLASPAAFGRATRVQESVRKLIPPSDGPEAWEVEVAAMLSQTGGISLPPETALKVYQGQALTPQEQAMADRLPELAANLIAPIPQMDGVRQALRYMDKHFDGSGTPDDRVQGRKIPWAARALKIALDFDVLQAQGMDAQSALEAMRVRKSWYDPALLKVFAGGGSAPGFQEQAETIQELPLSEVAPGMVFAEDVRTRTGAMLVARGTEVSPSLFERIKNLAATANVVEPVKMRVVEPIRIGA